MHALYGDTAVITLETSGELGYNKNWITYEQLTVKFANGITIKYRVYSDGSLGRKDITFPVNTGWEIAEAMSKVEFKTTVNC
jgi:hypothetical protein